MQPNKILSRLGPNFEVAGVKAAASLAELDLLRSASCIPVPSDYFFLVSEATDVELLIRGKRCLRIWSPRRAIEMNAAYCIQDYLPNSLAFGDDEGGTVLVFMTGLEGFGVYLAEFGNLDADDARFVSSSLHGLLLNEQGIHRFGA